MATTTIDILMEENVTCPICEDSVPRGHTVLRADNRRICWFCHTDDQDPSDPDDDGDNDDWDDEEEGWDDWDDD